MIGQFFLRRSMKKDGKQLFIVAGLISVDEGDDIHNGDMILGDLKNLGMLSNLQKQMAGESIDGVLTSPCWVPFWKKLK